MASTGAAVEADLNSGLGWGGDLSLDSTGDIVLAQDGPTSSNATQQRITRLILTTPALKDSSGNALGYADDIFHPKWGSGLRAYVDGAFNAQTLQQIAAAVQQQLAQDPAVSNTPTPTVSLSLQGTYTALLLVTFWTTSGQKQVLPTITLSPSNISIATSATAA